MLSSHVLAFTLTDGSARLPCKWLPWESGRRPLSHTPKAGDRVRVAVSYASWWKEGGRGEVVVSDIRLTGEGELLAARAALLARLAAEGLCDPAGFPPLPRFPTGVGLIAGRGSDAYHDVLRGLRERFPAVPVLACCCRIQGAGAVEAIIESLIALQAHPLVDVIVIARGGGSVQDLATFDDERLCRAIRAIGTPVVTAIGHTANNPVCSHVTHAAFVPRHAAERVVPDRHDLLRDVDDASAAMRRTAAGLKRILDELSGGRAVAVERLLRGRREHYEQELARIGETARQATDRLLCQHRSALTRGTGEIATASRRRMARLRTDIDSRLALLSAADFRERGWLLATSGGRAVTRASELEAGEHVRLHLLDGEAGALITDVHPSESEA